MSNFNLIESNLSILADNVKDYCLTNGLIFLTKSNNTNDKQSHDTASPLPVTLFPTKYPTNEFNYALDIQKSFNQLLFNISNDYEFLKETLKNVIKVDDFTCRLWNIYETVYSEGIAQPISLAILRNDFMLDKNKSNSSNPTLLSQIEINTISCSFGACTSKVTDLHRYVLNNLTNNQLFVEKNIISDNLKHAKNDNLYKMSKAIVSAWELYNNPNSKIVFLITENERNIGDQRLLEYECLRQNLKCSILRYTFSDISQRAKLDSQKRLFIDNNEIALVYYRAGYDPNHYLNEQDWNARLLIEKSMAIKCPNIQLHLVGAKIVQQALSMPNSIERFISDKSVVDRIRATFVDLYSITEENFNEILNLIESRSEEFVLKPQREGGGNNVYKEDIKKFVNSLEDKNELMSYILMKLVDPYLNENYLIRSGQSIQKQSLISEIGIFGFYIGKGNELLYNETGGYLLRTKIYGVNEGGVATGYSALDSICLV